MLDNVWLYTDGAARGNPGPAAAGFRILGPSGELLLEREKFLGKKTNNQAEYAALLLGLEASQDFTRGRVSVGSDSELMVNQMKGKWRVRTPELRKLHNDAQAKAVRFREVRYDHYPRSHPEIEAVDQALNRLLDFGSTAQCNPHTS